MAEQLAYPAATIESSGPVPGGWVLVDPTLQADSEDDVLRDGSDATWIESDCSWSAGTRPSVMMRVQTLVGKLPLRRPYIGAQTFKLRIRYRVAGSGTIGVGPMLEAIDFTSDHVNVASVPFPGRRNFLMGQTFTSELVEDGQWNDLEMSLPSTWLKGHEDGCKSIGGIPVIDSDLGMCLSVPQAFSGAPRFQISQAWFRVEEVERHESDAPDWRVIRTGAKDFEVVDVAGNWGANGGSYESGTINSNAFETQIFTAASLKDPTRSSERNAVTALADASRRALITKQYSGTAIVEIDPSCYSGSIGLGGGQEWDDPHLQPTFGDFKYGYDDGSSTAWKTIYAPTGAPSSPNKNTRDPIDGLIIRSPSVADGYRDGDARPSFATSELRYYDKVGSVQTYVEHGTLSLYGVRIWCTGQPGFFADFASGKPYNVTTLDWHDFQVTGAITLNGQGNPSNGGNEYKWGLRIGGLRIDFRRGFWGTGLEHCCYGTSPTGDSQLVECSNTIAWAFYPKYEFPQAPLVKPPSVPHTGNSFHQFVARTYSCTNNGNVVGSTPPGAGTTLVENCTGRNTKGTHFKCVHTLGTMINRRCRSFGVNGTQRAVQFTVESFGNVGQSTQPATFGVDSANMTLDGHYTTQSYYCTKGGGSANPTGNSKVGYPLYVPANSPWTYCFKKVVIEDLQVLGSYGNTTVQVAGAKEVVIDRGVNNSGKWPMFGFWEWGWYNPGSGNRASWDNGGCGAFDNQRIEFRNVGPNPHSYYNAPVQSNGGSTVSRLMVYGARSNPNRPGGATSNPAFALIGQIQQLAVKDNTANPLWVQTQKPDPNSAGLSKGHNWLYPCVTAPDFDDPDIYGGYFGNARRFPNFNTVKPPVERRRESPAVTVTLGTGGAVSATSPGLDRRREAQTATTTVGVNVNPDFLERQREAQTGSVSLSVNVTADALERAREAVSVGVSLDDQVDFSMYPATISFSVGLPDIITDTPGTPGTNTDGVSGGGSVDGGVG